METLLELASAHPVLVLTCIVVIAALGTKTYRVVNNPLSQVPGPTKSKWTNLRLKVAVLAGERVRYVHQLHQRYGPIVRISPTEVSLSDPAAAETIYKMGSQFYKSQWYPAFTGFKVDNVFTMLDPHKHGQHRKLAANNFSEKWIKNLEPFIAANVRLAIARMEDDVKALGHCDVFKWFSFMATDVIGEAAFGDSFRTLQTGKKNQYIADLENVGRRGTVRSDLPLFVNTMALLPFGPATEVKRVVARLGKYSEDSINRYWNALKADPDNVKPTLLAKEYTEIESGTLTTEQLRRDAAGYIVAGTDTTAITATYAVWHIAQHPEVQAELIREVSSLPQGFTDEDLKELKYLDAVIQETLRLSGAVQQGLPRSVPAGGADFCGYYIPAGATVGVQAYTLHHEPGVWREPDKFDPSRWLHATKEMRDSFYPFGGGSRICLGLHFAMLELRYAMANFYRTFESGVKPAHVDGFEDEDMVQMSFFLCPPKGKRCLVGPRK